MPVIRISDSTFASLKHIATWTNVDTPSQTVNQLVREKMEQLGLENDGPTNSESTIKTDDGVLIFEKAPGLSFTRVLSASVDKSEMARTNWAGILLKIIQKIHTNGLVGERLVQELQIPAKIGDHDQNGYNYHPDLGVSFQGQSAPDAWREIDRLAEKHSIQVEVVFQWRDNEKAQHPNRIGKIQARV